jgi:uncharacterized protein (TIGR02118 family)
VKRLTQWVPRPGVERGEAIQRWRTSHVSLVRRVPGVQRYGQNVCCPGPDGSEPPYAGLGELWFETLEDAQAALSTAEWYAVIDDASEFMDLDRVTAAWANEHRAFIGLAADKRASWLRRRFPRSSERFYPHTPPPTRFVKFTLPVPDNPEVAAEILEEAQELSQTAIEQGGAAERRATTLQGAVAIAATFSLAAGTLVAESDKIASQTWRVVFAVVVAAVVLAFVGAGVVALQATSKLEKWHDPDDEARFAERVGVGLAEARMNRAEELLEAYGHNKELAEWKITRASLAASWFRTALGLLLFLAGVFVTYAVFG